MTAPIGGAVGGSAAPPSDPRAALRRLAHELEGVFLSQLFAAMRATVPQEGLVSATPGQDMFNAMLDERLADLAAQRLQRGMGEALYRQLSRGLMPAPEDP